MYICTYVCKYMYIWVNSHDQCIEIDILQFPYIYIYICIHTHICIYMNASSPPMNESCPTCEWVMFHEWMSHIHIYIYIWVNSHVPPTCVSIYVHVYMHHVWYIYMYVYIYTCVYIFVYMSQFTRTANRDRCPLLTINVYICIHICIYIYIYEWVNSQVQQIEIDIPQFPQHDSSIVFKHMYICVYTYIYMCICIV